MSSVKELALEEIRAFIKANGGRATPREIVDLGRDEDLHLHQMFDWNDKTAAEHYREDQARELIRSCRVEVSIQTHKVKIPEYIRDPTKGASDAGYIETKRVKSCKDRIRDTMLMEINNAASAVRRLRQLSQYFEVTEEVDEFLESIESIRVRVETAPVSLQM